MIRKYFNLIVFYKDALLLFLFRLLKSKNIYAQHTPDFITKIGLFPSFHSDGHVFRKRNKRSLGDPNRWIQLNLFLDYAKTLKIGDYAELGTFRGITAKIIFNQLPSESKLFCFDTFEGFAESDVRNEAEKINLNVKVGHFSNTSSEYVERYILNGKDNEERLKLVKGFFPQTFNGFEQIKWRFVHLDADLYEPMLAGMNAFWENIVPGGVLLIHDYNGTYKGTKKAVDEFFKDKLETPVPLTDKVGSVVIIKLREKE